MLKFASYAMRGPIQAAFLASGLMVLEFFIPPAAWLSGAIIGLVFLRKGMTGGVPTTLIGTLIFSVLIFFLSGSFLPGVQLVAFFWIPVIILALVLRSSVDLGRTFLIAGLMALLVVLGLYLFLGDPAWFWESIILEQFPITELARQAQLDEEFLKESIHWSSQFMSGVLATVVMVGAMVSLLLARYWQAALYNPNGFQQEFHKIRFGSLPAALAIAVAVVSIWIRLPVFLNIAPIVITLFAVQGLAVLHNLVKVRKMSTGWLVGIYLLMIFLLPHTTILLGALGMADNWLNVRRQIGN